MRKLIGPLTRLGTYRGPWRRRHLLWLGWLLLLVLFVYVFFISGGTFHRWPIHNTYYDDLAEGFRLGQLSITTLPSPQLLAKANPFDYANRPLWSWDATLYKNKYYIYWGHFRPFCKLLPRARCAFRGLSAISISFSCSLQSLRCWAACSSSELHAGCFYEFPIGCSR